MIVKPRKEIMAELARIGVNHVDNIRLPKRIKISHGSSMKIKKRACISRTFCDEICRYEVKMFGCDMDFFAPSGLTGAQIYSICEGIYLEDSNSMGLFNQ